jgi:hypothetical protein
MSLLLSQPQLEKVRFLKAKYFTEDAEHRQLINDQLMFSVAIQNHEASLDQIKIAADSLKASSAKLQTTLQKAFLARNVSLEDENDYIRKTKEINDEIEKRKITLPLLEKELHQAQLDLIKITSLNPYIEGLSNLPAHKDLEQEKELIHKNISEEEALKKKTDENIHALKIRVTKLMLELNDLRNYTENLVTSSSSSK